MCWTATVTPNEPQWSEQHVDSKEFHQLIISARENVRYAKSVQTSDSSCTLHLNPT